MTKHFNNLSPDQTERLAVLSEELGETVQAIGKILRHGYDSCHPVSGQNNRESLERELGDVRFAINWLCDCHDLSEKNIEDFARLKNLKIGEFLHHQDA